MAYQRGFNGLVYLIHFDETYEPYPGAVPRDCAGHYTGLVPWGHPRNLKRRLSQHGTERGARLMLAVRKKGITWQLARVWRGGPERERQLKRQGGAKRRCPLCGVTPRFRLDELPLTSGGQISRTLTTELHKHLAGVMTSAQRAEHTALRKGMVTGRVCGLDRLPKVPVGDQWYVVPPVSADCGARQQA